jgi:cytochrome c oxidase subunit I+III
VFPLFGAFYYWAPMLSRNQLSERMGRWVFWLMFAGFNLSFFPMHIAGLRGMVRRIWTYPADLGLDWLNLVSTIGAFILALGIAIFIVDMILNFRVGKGPENPWNAGTLEWLPNDVYGTRSIPFVTSREPLWDQPNLARNVEAGRYFLPNAPTGGREMLVTSPIHATPQYVMRMPGPGWAHLIAAVFTAAFFLLLTIKAVIIASICGLIAIAACYVWVWQLDPAPRKAPVDIGGGIALPAQMSGPRSHSWWAMIILILVAGSLYVSYVFSYFYLWTVSPAVWGRTVALPPLSWAAISALLLLASAVFMALAGRALGRARGRSALVPLSLLASMACLLAGVAFDLWGHWQSGLRPTAHAYSAMVYMAGTLNAQVAIAVAMMAAFVIARHFAGMLAADRRNTLDNTALLTYYAIAQSLVSLIILYGFPRLVQ